MRVIAGRARRIQLSTPLGLETRPTADRIKETLFNILHDELYDCRFLDLFSGSGAIGIEALSRGAQHVDFIENNKSAVECIEKNLQMTHLGENCRVWQMNALDGLSMLESKGNVYDIIFMDPPYNRSLEENILNYLRNSKLISTDTMIIIETSRNAELDYLSSYGFEVLREKIYKTNKHIFIRFIQ